MKIKQRARALYLFILAKIIKYDNAKCWEVQAYEVILMLCWGSLDQCRHSEEESGSTWLKYVCSTIQNKNAHASPQATYVQNDLW